LCEATDSVAQMQALGGRLSLDLSREGERFRARREIAQVVGAWIGLRPFEQVAQAFDRHGVCWSRYQSVAELVASDPECSPANPMFVTIDQPGVGPVLAPRIPLDFAQPDPLPPGPAPRLGEHTEQVLGELLGIGTGEFGKLLERRVVGVAGPT
jgi:2-methylfumaryl-CoA isomerase